MDMSQSALHKGDTVFWLCCVGEEGIDNESIRVISESLLEYFYGEKFDNLVKNIFRVLKILCLLQSSEDFFRY